MTTLGTAWGRGLGAQCLKPFLDLGYLYTLQVDAPSLDPAFVSLLSILFCPRQEANDWR